MRSELVWAADLRSRRCQCRIVAVSMPHANPSKQETSMARSLTKARDLEKVERRTAMREKDVEALPVASGIVKAHNPFIAAAASLGPRTALHAIKDQAPGSEAIAPTSTGSPKAVPVPWASKTPDAASIPCNKRRWAAPLGAARLAERPSDATCVPSVRQGPESSTTAAPHASARA
mgnify:CR=1 FL=1